MSLRRDFGVLSSVRTVNTWETLRDEANEFCIDMFVSLCGPGIEFYDFKKSCFRAGEMA